MSNDLNVQGFLRNSAMAVCIVFLVYAGLILFLTWPISTFSIDKAGTFGDSFGVITSLFTGLGFAGLLTTIFLQREDLKLSRIELQETRNEIRLQSETFHRQRFEDSFYRLLALYRENLKEIIVRKGADSRLHGIEALAYLTAQLDQEWSQKGLQFPQHDDDKQKEYIISLGLSVQTTLTRHARYIETFTCLLSLIDEECASPDRKPLYWKILSSQLTAHEIKYLFYQSFVVDSLGAFREMVKNSGTLRHRLETMNLQHGHRKAFEKVWSITVATCI